MSNIGNYNSTNNADNPISYAKTNDYTEKVRNFVKYLHEFLPVLEKEFDDLEIRAASKPCQAFDDKMSGLSAIYQAEKKLYEWYIVKQKRQAQ